MKKAVCAFAFLLFLVPSVSSAAGLTYQQASSIVVLLQSFGVDQATLNEVWTDIAPADTPLSPPTTATSQEQQPAYQAPLQTQNEPETLAPQANDAPTATLYPALPSEGCGTSEDHPSVSIVPQSTGDEIVGQNYIFVVTVSGDCVGQNMTWSAQTTNSNNNIPTQTWSASQGATNVVYLTPQMIGPQTIVVNVDGTTAVSGANAEMQSTATEEACVNQKDSALLAQGQDASSAMAQAINQCNPK